MSDEDVELAEQTELERVVQWRFDRLRQAGIGKEIADALSTRLDVDLHRVIEMKAGGCHDGLIAGITL